MLSKNLIPVLVAVMPATAAAAPVTGEEAPIPGYGIEPIQWEVQVTPGGPLVNLTGTVEQVHDELIQMNPNFEIDFPTQSGKSLKERTDFGGSSYNCNTNVFGLAHKGRIEGGIRYLRGVGGQPSNGPGPGNCGRVSCSHDSAIWWCNDARETKTLASFSSIADGAQYIVDRCSFNNGYGTWASGQVFHKTSWNVITRNAAC